MASRSLTVIAQVKDAASAPLKRIADSFDNTNKSIQKSSVNISEFNKAIFATTAFVGLFSKAMGGVVSALSEAGQYDRISEQFERVMGPKGNLFQAIDGMTNNSIDRIAAMKSGIALGTLGMVDSTEQLAELMARAGTAAKRSGMDSAEGIEHLTAFMKTGEVTNLAFLNVLSAINPELQTQMAILHKAGGAMGGVIATQARLRMGMSALAAATQDMKGDGVDLMDVVADLKQSFTSLSHNVSIFLGKALTPIGQKLKSFMFGMGDLIERLRKSDPYIIKTARNIIMVVTALTSLVAVVGTASLAMKAFAALGIPGLPLLVLGLLGLAASFTDVESSTKGFTDFFKKVGAVLLGTFQLVSSFVGDADNFSKGIGKMDSELHDFLSKQGLLELTKNISRVSAVIITFVRDVGSKLIEWFKNTSEFISPLTSSIANLFGKSDPTEWSRKWVESGSNIRGALVWLAAGALTAFAAIKTLKFGMGLLGKIPVVGKLFGGGKDGKAGAAGKAGASVFGGPDGTSGNPIYVRIAGGTNSPLGTAVDAVTTSGVPDLVTTTASVTVGSILSKYLIVPLTTLAVSLKSILLGFLALPSTITAALTTATAAAMVYIGLELARGLRDRMADLFPNIEAKTVKTEQDRNQVFKAKSFGDKLLGLINPFAEGGPTKLTDLFTNGAATDMVWGKKPTDQGPTVPAEISAPWITPAPVFNAAQTIPMSQVFGMGMIPPQDVLQENLGKQISQAKDTFTKQGMQEAMQAALRDTITPGIITPEEYGEIMSAALDKAKMTTLLDNIHSKNRPTPQAKTSRGC